MIIQLNYHYVKSKFDYQTGLVGFSHNHMSIYRDPGRNESKIKTKFPKLKFGIFISQQRVNMLDYYMF